MLVIAVVTGPRPDGRTRWAGRRHDDDRPGVASGSSAADLFDTVFHALHDGEQVALGFDCPLTVPVPPDQGAVPPDQGAVPPDRAEDQPGLAELAWLLGELDTWRPWTTVSTSLARWRANTSILLWQAVPVEAEVNAEAEAGAVMAAAAADSFFRELPGATHRGAEEPAGAVINLAAVAVRRSGLFIDASELSQPAVSITVTSG
jgi:hypothetical protein